MNTIIFAFDNWSDDYDWWVPNNWPADFCIDGKLSLPISHDRKYFMQQLNTLDHDHGNLENLKLPANKSERLHNYKNIKFCNINNVNGKYIFPIFIRTRNYFFKMQQHGLKFISSTVINDVAADRARIVFIHPLEGSCGRPDWDILQRWIETYQFKKNQVHFIHGNFDIPPESTNFSYHPVSSFQANWQKYTNIIDYTPISNAKLFLCYNRATRKHRTLLVCELQRHLLLNKGIISYHSSSNSTRLLVQQYNREDLYNAAGIIDNLLPMYLEYDLSVINPAFSLTEDHHRHTFLSLVTETITEDEVVSSFNSMQIKFSPLFFSEKTWKPISIGQPFIIIASKGHLKHLRNIGYRTFDHWWSEEYDNVDEINTKLDLILQELTKLSKLTDTELINLRKEMEPILTHNQRLFNDYQKSFIDQMAPTYEIVNDIWQELNS